MALEVVFVLVDFTPPATIVGFPSIGAAGICIGFFGTVESLTVPTGNPAGGGAGAGVAAGDVAGVTAGDDVGFAGEGVQIVRVRQRFSRLPDTDWAIRGRYIGVPIRNRGRRDAY